MAKARKGSIPPSTVRGGAAGRRLGRRVPRPDPDLIAYGHRLDACRDAFAAIVASRECSTRS